MDFKNSARLDLDLAQGFEGVIRETSIGRATAINNTPSR
jgi:hypothetical protein